MAYIVLGAKWCNSGQWKPKSPSPLRDGFKITPKIKVKIVEVIVFDKGISSSKGEEESQRDFYELYSFKNGTKEEIHSLHLK